MNFQDGKNQKINFDQILSRRSGCGLIWTGTVEGQPCVIKMIMLTSGIHYDKTKQIYCQGDQSSPDDKSTSYVFASGNLEESHNLPFRLVPQPVTPRNPPRNIPINTPMQPRNIPINTPMQPRNIPINTPMQPRNIPINTPMQPRNIPINTPMQPRNIPINTPMQLVNRGLPSIPIHYVNRRFPDICMQPVNRTIPITAEEFLTPVKNQGKQLTSDDLKSYFQKNDNDPYRHIEFRHRRAISRQAFLSEITELTHLGLLNLAPKVYGYYFSDPMAPIHYGFIVMEKVDSSVKNILCRRALDQSEEEIINQLINHMHQSYGSVHGDLQPSNIGVYLNHKGQISKACFFDCQKIKHKEKYSSEGFQKLIEKDWKMYNKFNQLICNRREKPEDCSKDSNKHD